eukprot:Nk52_evm3s294 gene=Nk52_evmTU3s294
MSDSNSYYYRLATESDSLSSVVVDSMESSQVIPPREQTNLRVINLPKKGVDEGMVLRTISNFARRVPKLKLVLREDKYSLFGSEIEIPLYALIQGSWNEKLVIHKGASDEFVKFRSSSLLDAYKEYCQKLPWVSSSHLWTNDALTSVKQFASQDGSWKRGCELTVRNSLRPETLDFLKRAFLRHIEEGCSGCESKYKDLHWGIGGSSTVGSVYRPGSLWYYAMVYLTYAAFFLLIYKLISSLARSSTAWAVFCFFLSAVFASWCMMIANVAFGIDTEPESYHVYTHWDINPRLTQDEVKAILAKELCADSQLRGRSASDASEGLPKYELICRENKQT